MKSVLKRTGEGMVEELYVWGFRGCWDGGNAKSMR